MPRRAGVLKGLPDGDAPIFIENRPVVSGGSLAKPIVVEPVEQEGQDVFCKVSNTTQWFTLFVTGCPFSKRPLAASTWTTLVRDKLREHDLRAALRPSAVADLGMDDDDPQTTATDSRSKRKRRKQSQMSNPIVELEVPIQKHSMETQKIQVLNRNLKDAVWLKLDSSNLTWARNYVRSELDLSTHKDQGARADRKEGVTEVAKWCSRASCWRVNFQGRVRNVFVARTPEETFTSRSENAKLKATTIYQRMAENR